MPLPKLMKISELLQENLLLHYHPNVPPLPNPLLAELNAVKAQLKEQMELRTKMQQTAEENIRLKAQLEILERIMAKK